MHTELVWFRGCIDNKTELARQLGLATCSLSEFLPQAFAKWGIDCPNRFDGSFAFQLKNSKGRTELLARDPSGTHPLYYSYANGDIVVAGSIRSLVAKLPSPPEECTQTLVSWVVFRAKALDRNATLLHGVKRLPPGYRLFEAGNEPKVEPYWNFVRNQDLNKYSNEEIWSEFRNVLNEAVDRCIGSSATGFHVTGGLDSSFIGLRLVTECAKRGLQPPWQATWTPNEGSIDSGTLENRTIQAVLKSTKLPLERCPAHASSIREVLSRNITSDPWMLADVMLHERAVQLRASDNGVTTLFSGWGGEYAASRSLGSRFRRHLIRTGQFKRYFKFCPSSRNAAIGDFIYLFKNRGRNTENYLSKEALELVKGPRSLQSHEEDQFETPSAALFYDYTYERVEAFSCSAAELGISYVHPLLDRKVIEFAWQIPDRACAHREQSRWQFRQAIRPQVPHEVVENSSKREPTRIDYLNKVIRKVYADIGHELRTRSVPPGRAGLIDMPRLLRDLEPSALEKRKRLRPIAVALSILEF